MNPSEFDLARQQVLAHLRYLRGAGIEWLPTAPPLQVAAPVAPQQPQPAVAETSMFDIAPETLAGSDLSLEERRLALKTLADEVKACTKCAELCSTRTQTVFADGEPGVELCFIGEA